MHPGSGTYEAIGLTNRVGCFPADRKGAPTITSKFQDPHWEPSLPDDSQVFFPEEFVCAVGRLTLTAGTLETRLLQAISLMLHTDDVGATILTADVSFRWLLERCQALAHARLSQPLLGEAIEWLQEVGRVSTERNQVVHATWFRSVWKDTTGAGGYGDLKLGRVTARSFKRGLETSRVPTSARDIERIVKEMERTLRNGEDILGRIRSASADGPFRHS